MHNLSVYEKLSTYANSGDQPLFHPTNYHRQPGCEAKGYYFELFLIYNLVVSSVYIAVCLLSLCQILHKVLVIDATFAMPNSLAIVIVLHLCVGKTSM